MSESVDLPYSAYGVFCFVRWTYANVSNFMLLVGVDSDTWHLFYISVTKSIITFFHNDSALRRLFHITTTPVTMLS